MKATRADETSSRRQEGNISLMTLRETKTHIIHSIGVKYSHYVRKYLDLRPPKTETNRSFLSYCNGKYNRLGETSS